MSVRRSTSGASPALEERRAVDGLSPDDQVHTGGVVDDFLLVGIFALIALALVVALVFQWRDDHKGLRRRMH